MQYSREAPFNAQNHTAERVICHRITWMRAPTFSFFHDLFAVYTGAFNAEEIDIEYFSGIFGSEKFELWKDYIQQNELNTFLSAKYAFVSPSSIYDVHERSRATSKI
jgi:hypothetical protein